MRAAHTGETKFLYELNVVIMDYEELHKDTIAKLQEMVNSGKITVEIARGICTDFVPESEDDRIRKEMIEIIGNEAKEFPSSIIASKANSWITYLEKQGEQKLVDWNEEDENMLDNAITACNQYYFSTTSNWLKSIKERVQPQPKQGEQKPIREHNVCEDKYGCVSPCSNKLIEEQNPVWSEEDEYNFAWIYETLIGFDGNDLESYNTPEFLEKCKKAINWFKCLKERYTTMNNSKNI